MFKIKEEYKSKITMFKTKDGAQVMFNGTKNYTQQQLEKYSTNEYFKQFIEEQKEIEIKQKVTDFKLVYVNTLKHHSNMVVTNDDLTLKELREKYPHIKASSKKDFLKKINENG